jgi:hypothetical protein
MLTIIIFLILSYLYQWGDTPIPLSATILTSLFFVVIGLLFYKLTITINENFITATFGIGWIKKSLKIDSIKINSLEETVTPWYYGIGIRFTPKGILYNTKAGKAIILKTKDGAKTILFGTNNFDKIRNVLLNKK